MTCACQGMTPFPSPCDDPATQEDGLCDTCRTNGCAVRRKEVLAALRFAAVKAESIARIVARMEVAE